MSTATADDTKAAYQAYYDYLKCTLDVAQDLTERLIFLEEPTLAASALVVRSQLASMVDAEIQGQVASIPMGDTSG